MADVYNSCGKRGCDSRDLTLPNDGKFNDVSVQVHGIWDDLEEILPIPGLYLDKKLAKKRQMEAVDTEGDWLM